MFRFLVNYDSDGSTVAEYVTAKSRENVQRQYSSVRKLRIGVDGDKQQTRGMVLPK